MNVKIFSVRADSDFRAIRIGQESGKVSANEFLEREIQNFMNAHSGIRITHLHFSAVPIVPKTASWDTTNPDIEWEIEKSVVTVYEQAA